MMTFFQLDIALLSFTAIAVSLMAGCLSYSIHTVKKKLVKVSNYAHATGLSAVHVYRLIKQGKIKSENIDGVIFVVKED